MSKRSNISKLLFNLYFLAFLSFIFTLNTVVLAKSTSSNSSDPDALIALFGLIFYALCCLAIFIPQIVFAVWVYKDAKKLNVDNPILWAILSFLFFPLLTIIYYLVVRKEAKQKLERNSVN